MTEDLMTAARAWIAADPDPDTAAALQELVDAGEVDAVAARVGESLAFGTAGLRGEVGPGPNRMNRAVVIRATRGVADHLLARIDDAAERGVAVGFDARPDSERFAHDVVAVLRAAGIRVMAFTEPVATPIVAYAARSANAAGAIVVTASHNPPADNGYKVYDEFGVQITPPRDAQIAAAIATVGPANQVAGVGEEPTGVEELGASLVSDYLAAIAAARPTLDVDHDIGLVVTPMHGTGGAPVQQVLGDMGYEVVRVEEQWEPDGAFPTVTFPNPEEPGALDLAFATAERVGATAVLANDPDTDRLAVAIPDGGAWRRLTGDEVGVVLAHHLLSTIGQDCDQPLVANSIVSSARLGRVAAAFDARHEVTLTGFKWLWRAGRELEDEGWQWVMGYEEALGYSVTSLVRDKDGISAAVVMADLVGLLAAQNRTVVDLLVELDGLYGPWVNVQQSVRFEGDDGPEAMLAAVDRAADVGADALPGRTIARVVDHRQPLDGAPVWMPTTPLVVWHLDGGGRVLVRPSGTEPKLKLYVDVPLSAGEDHGMGDSMAAAGFAAIDVVT
ncbi:MAG TPA: phospho-sugar mutase [Nitriliruptoraceae bacterium]|nr:phospho-sugar mutase [Nitriliruptoraceae bacterium]